MATNYAEQIAVLQENDAETRRIVAALQVRLDTIAENAKAENKDMHSTYLNELAVLRTDMSRLFDDLAGRIADMRSDTDKRFGELRAEMDKRFGEVEKRFGELRAEMEKSASEREVRMMRVLNAHTKWTVGAVFTAVAVFFALSRYLGPPTGAG